MIPRRPEDASMIKPYYSEPGIEIYAGDARHIMPHLPPVDLIVTDPPYGLDYNNGDLASQREKCFGGDVERMKPRPIANDGEADAMQLFEDFLSIASGKLLKGGCCCCCGGGGGPKPLFAKWTLLMDKYIGFKQAVVWDKGGLGMGIHYRRNYEFVLIAQKGAPARVWNGGNTTPNVWRIPKIIPREDQHPTEKPLALAIKIIEIHSNPGDLILDPFMGKGWAVIAAKMTGRRAIGIEWEREHLESAVRKVRNFEVLPLNQPTQEKQEQGELC